MHLFDRLCRQHAIEHRLTKPNLPRTDGEVERMNPTVKDATVKRYHYTDHQQLTDTSTCSWPPTITHAGSRP